MMSGMGFTAMRDIATRINEFYVDAKHCSLPFIQFRIGMSHFLWLGGRAQFYWLVTRFRL